MIITRLADHAANSPHALAYTFVRSANDPGLSITYKQLYQSSSVLAARLLIRSEPGSRALLLYPAGIDFVIAFYACLIAGMIAVPVCPPRGSKKVERLAAIFRDCEPDLFLSISATLKTVHHAFAELEPLREIECLATDTLIAEGNTDEISADNLNLVTRSYDVAFLQYTSGSTGFPKGVVVTHGNIDENSVSIQQAFQLSAASSSVCWLPHFHDMGLIDGIIQPLFTGFNGVLLAPETFVKRPVVWLQLISRFAATHSGGPNSAYELCVHRISDADIHTLDLRHWQGAYCGAEPIRAEVLEAFERKFRACGFRTNFFYPCYGMAEATLMISGGDIEQDPQILTVSSSELAANRILEVDTDSEPLTRLVSCGSARSGLTVLIVNPETLLPSEDGHVGEIWVSGSSVAHGYWHQPKLTEEIFRARCSDSTPGCFLRTGDLGFIKNGDLYITGRIKDVIIYNGQNHYPQDIEHSVQACSDALVSNRGAAFSVICGGRESVVVAQELKRTHLTQAEIQLICREVRAAVSMNHGLYIDIVVLVKRGGIPMTSSGKIQRRLCRDRYLNQSLPVIAQSTEPSSASSSGALSVF
ncbi:MAG: fatty acyl-AMP ligase [Cyanobacteriota bacterium]|jgi:acyl-CoA synthetase (AMP-forming)/AMP-acid ligase II